MRTTMKRVLAVGLALLPLGCSVYYSSESSVKSVTIPSRSSASSSDSSKDDGDEEQQKEAYREDVRDYTASYAAARQDLDGFERGLDEVARRHGVTDWEADDATWVGIGAGLKRAKASGEVVARYEIEVGRGEPLKQTLIRRGYDS